MKNGGTENRRRLTESEIRAICESAVDRWNVDDTRLLLVIPDHTRSCPLSVVFRILYELLAPRVKAFDVLVALGTHPPMTETQISERVGVSPAERRAKYPKASFFNHVWNDRRELADTGRLTAEEVREITGGLFEMDVTITCNRMVLTHDLIVIVGPVFPHEVVGFSGGNKYLFPGIAGPEIIHFFHWLGAVITSPVIIGNKWTPVRRVVDRAAAMLPVERRALCMVAHEDGLAGLFAGTPEEAWPAAADLSARLHICRKEKPFHTVLSCAPSMYDDLWTGGKCMYKVEPVVADGGTVIIYAPHITEISRVHGAVLHQVGYHTRDFFLRQWEKYKNYPWGILAHSTHVKGIGKYENGIEKPRVEVVLATGIPESVCRRVNLGYTDCGKIRRSDYEGRQGEGVLCVPKAGETLYRWNDAPAALGGQAPGGGR
jgi:nickel-dependent lactate racemase